MRYFARLFFTTAVLLVHWSPLAADVVPVTLKQSESGWQLYRGGKPYFIKGAGGTYSMERLAATGANSIRTWGTDGAQEILDEAQSLGLTVTLGIWLGHERHGFDYTNEEQVAEQLERARRDVLRYKDHPALLLWAIGNEMEGFKDGENPLIWKAVEDVAALVKKLDPHHPTMTVTAELGGKRIDYVHNQLPSIDIHGINSYGGAPSVPERLAAGGGRKPYVLTEFGPRGSWEVGSTDWGAPLEPTSSEKAEFYRESYQKAVLGAPDRALGSYAFVWGFKMETTATWFGMVLKNGSKLAAVDTMTELWSGQAPENRVPAVEPLVLDGASSVKPGEVITISAVVADPENDTLSADWALLPEAANDAVGGDFRPSQPAIEEAVLESKLNTARIRMPEYPGAYRIFYTVEDDQGGAALANLPVLVEGEVRPRMPTWVYSDYLEGMPWVPSGMMGNHKQLTIDGRSTEHVYAGDHSIKLRYEGVFNWVGVAWQHPANNWGEEDGGFDVTGATRLELWARGAYGGEKVAFGVGIIGKDRPFPDTAIAKVDDIVLTDTWTRYEVPLRRKDLSSIKTGFVLVVSGRRTPVTFYLDNIRFVRK